MKIAALFLILAGPAPAGEVIAVVEDSAGKPVADAVVFVYESPAKPPPAQGAAVMDQIGKEFSPHVLTVEAGTRVRFPNRDQIHHHVYSFSKAKKFEVPLYKGEEAEPVVLDKPGVIKLGCNIHDWMLGYILVVDNPYFMKTGADGRAVLSDVPEGAYRFAVWSERLKGTVDETLQKASIGKTPTRLQFRPKLGPSKKRVQPALSAY